MMPPATHVRQMRRICRTIAVLIYATLILCPRPAAAYSVLAHEAVVDSMWDDVVSRLLRQRFPGVSSAELEKARAFDEKTAAKLVADRNYQALDQMVIEHLMGK